MEIVFIIIVIGVIIYIATRPKSNSNKRIIQNSQVNQAINNSYKYIQSGKPFQPNKEPSKPTLNYGSMTLNFVKSNSVSDYIIYFPKRPILNSNNFYPITIVRWLQENDKQFDSQKPVVELRLDNYIAQGVILGLTGTLHIGKKAGESLIEGEELCRLSFYNPKISAQNVPPFIDNKSVLNKAINFITDKTSKDHSNNLLEGIKLLPIKIIYSESVEIINNLQEYEYSLNVEDINYFGKHFENAVIKRWFLKNGDYVTVGQKVNELALDIIFPAFSYCKQSGFLEILKQEQEEINFQDIIFKISSLKPNLNRNRIFQIPVNNSTDSEKNEDIIEVGTYNTQIPVEREENFDSIPPDFDYDKFWLSLPNKYYDSFIRSNAHIKNLVELIYLKIIELLKTYCSQEGASFFERIQLTNKRILTISLSEDHYGQDYYFKYTLNSFFTCILKVSEGILELKYKIRNSLEYEFRNFITQVLHQLKLTKPVEEIEKELSEFEKLIPEADILIEKEINKIYTTRWKDKFQNIKNDKENLNNASQVISSLDELIDINQKNYSLRNIYFEASKLVYDVDIFKSVFYFTMYRYISLNGNFNMRPFPSIIKKALKKSNPEIFPRLEILYTQPYKVKNKREVIRLYDDLEKIMIKPKKKITLNKNKVKNAEKEHERIKKKVEKILGEENTAKEVGISLKSSKNKTRDQTEEVIASVKLTNIQILLLEKLLENNNEITENDVKLFGKENNQPHNLLIDSINEALFEKFDDNIIFEENSNFYINKDYIEEINTIIIKE